MRDGEPQPIADELIVPVAALAFTGYYFWSILDAPWTAKVGTYCIGGVLIGLVVAFLAGSLRAIHAGRARLRFAALARPPGLAWRRVALLAVSVVYVVGLQWAGFTLASFAFMWVAIVLLGGRVLVAGATSVGFSLAGWILFIAVFETRFPKGPFERLMDALLR